MTITPKQRLEQYRKSSESIKDVYSSEEASLLHSKIINKYSLTNDDLYLDIVGDTVLGFYKTTDLPRLFQNHLMVGADQSQRMTSDLLEFLSPVIEREEAEVKMKKEDLDKLAKTFEEASKKPKVEEAAEEVASETPESPTPPTPNEPKPSSVDDVKPLRTMKDDINRIHGYGAYRDQNPIPADAGEEPTIVSSQETTLGQNRPVAEVPKYEAEDK